MLRNSPVVEQPSTDEELASRCLKNALGHSALVDFLLAGTVHEWWFLEEREVRAHPPGTGTELGVKLVDRTIDTCAERNRRLLWLLQGSARNAGATVVVEHARSRGVPGRTHADSPPDDRSSSLGWTLGGQSSYPTA